MAPHPAAGAPRADVLTGRQMPASASPHPAPPHPGPPRPAPPAAGPTPASPRQWPHGPAPLRWWREVATVAVFYAVYTVIRDIGGDRPVTVARALRNADRVIGLERTLGVFHEAGLQHALLPHHLIIELLDDWYGSTHFLVTGGVLAALYLTRTATYRRWRNTLAATTALALIGFTWYPMMPPRLLPAHYGFTDTLRVIGGLWSFDSGPMAHLSNQFAAMPSLHFAWALWSGLAIAALARRWWTRTLGALYPAVTLVCVLVTANHLLTDVAAGAATVGIGWVLARAAELVPTRAGRWDPTYPPPDATRRPTPVAGANIVSKMEDGCSNASP